MTIDDALGPAGRAAGVAHRRRGLFVELRPLKCGWLGGQQFLIRVHLTARVSQGLGQGWIRLAGWSCYQDVTDRFHIGQHPREQWHQCGVHDDDVILGMVGDVGELPRVEPQVQGMQHRAHGWHGQVGLQVLGVVPEQRRDPLVAANAQPA